MSSTRRADPDLDDPIAEITIDCYDDDEALIGFENAFDEAARLPCPAVVVGQDVQLLIRHRPKRSPRTDRHLPTRRPPPERASRHRDRRRPARLTPTSRLPSWLGADTQRT
jgi:hypothetical protein